MNHPYIGKTFRVRRPPFVANNIGVNDIPSAVCVAIGQCGTSATEDGCAYVGAYLRLADGTHINVELDCLVGPLEDM